jgi:hypothetical protein
MPVFRHFEIDVLYLLMVPKLGMPLVQSFVRDANFMSYNYSGAGYFLCVRHPCLPAARMVLTEPQVIGVSGPVQSGFIIFIESGELMLECHSSGDAEMPLDFREQNVFLTIA